MAVQYRPDIDGLRALSVSGVIAYHLGAGLPGGFVGVDAFLVISGFLITRIIMLDLEADTFSAVDFWQRRVRRIWPAFLAVIVAVLAAGWFLLVPEDYRVLGKDSLWQCLMVANIHFWSEAGYFAPDSETRPLLHLWSLSLEEQFYLCFPPVLAGLWALGRRACVRWLSTILLVSLVLSIVLVHRSPEATFYLLPTRAWELLAGSWLALVNPPIRSRISHELAALGGLAMITVPAIAYGPSTPFPGGSAVPVCLGTVLLLWAGSRPDSRVSRLLGCGPLRELGRRSYSAYLWHWPLIAFAHSWYGDELPAWTKTCILAATAVLSWASFRWIEQPFRSTRAAGASNGRVFAIAGSASAAVIVASVFVIVTRGVPERFSERIRAMMVPQPIERRWESPGADSGESTGMFVPIGAPLAMGERPCFILIGDSHGMAISPAVDAAAREANLTGMAALLSSGFPGDGIWSPNEPAAVVQRDRHNAWIMAVYEAISTLRPRMVLVCARWSAYLSEVPDVGTLAMIAKDGKTSVTAAGAEEAASDSLRRFFDRCRDVGASVTIMLEVPYQELSPRHFALSMAWGGGTSSLLGSDREVHRTRQEPVRRVLERIGCSERERLDLAAPLFASGERSLVGQPDGLWYSDSHHLSVKGAREALRSLFDGFFLREVALCQPLGDT